MKNLLLVTDVESDDVVSILLLLAKFSKKYDINTMYILTTDYNTYIKKLQIDEILKKFNYSNIVIKTNYLNCDFDLFKYPDEGNGVIIDKDKSPNLSDNHNSEVCEDIINFFHMLDDIDLILLSNIQHIPDIILPIFHKINDIIIYGGIHIDRISYSWKRSSNDINMLFHMAKEHNTDVYIMSPMVIYGNMQPDILSIYNEDKDIVSSYKELVKSIRTFPSIWKIIQNWCIHKIDGGLSDRIYKKVNNIPRREVKKEISTGYMIMTPADISTIIMYLSIIEDNINDNFSFNNYEDIFITDQNKIKYTNNTNGDNGIFHICTYSSNENFVNYLNYLVNYINNINI